MSIFTSHASRRASAVATLAAAVLMPLAGAGIAQAAPTISATPTKNLHAGSVVKVTMRGLDPLSGYYVGLCQNKYSGKVRSVLVSGSPLVTNYGLLTPPAAPIKSRRMASSRGRSLPLLKVPLFPVRK